MKTARSTAYGPQFGSIVCLSAAVCSVSSTPTSHATRITSLAASPCSARRTVSCGESHAVPNAARMLGSLGRAYRGRATVGIPRLAELAPMVPQLVVPLVVAEGDWAAAEEPAAAAT